MRKKINFWIEASRIHTLPLSISGVILASFLAYQADMFNYLVFLFSFITTLLLQILANFANDLGDALKGTDDKQRLGPSRMVQSGKISPANMKKAIWFVSFLAFISGSLLIYFGTKNLSFKITFLFYILGLLSIMASIKYTIGKKSFGYLGLGDVFVFIFFGLVAVVGTFFLHTNYISFPIFLPAISIGCLCVGVINLNNLRDIDNDKKYNKKTIAVRLGKRYTKIYHAFLIICAVCCALTYVVFNFNSYFNLLFVISIPFLIKNIISVFNYTDAKDLIYELKRLSMATLIFSISFGIGMLF